MSSLTCTVSKGDIPIKIFWILNGKDVNSYEGISVIRTNKRISQLSIDSASAEHSGEYVCVAENSAGKTSHSAALHVNGKVRRETLKNACFSRNSFDSLSKF